MAVTPRDYPFTLSERVTSLSLDCLLSTADNPGGHTIPLIALCDQIPLKPGFPLIPAITGALAGGMIMLAPGVLARWISPKSHFVPFSMAELAGWPSLGAAIGATAMLFYSWLLSRYVLLVQKGS
jgi:hypothetical protein